jgi:uncharacterized membrane protein SpoIIM required for sporulation
MKVTSQLLKRSTYVYVSSIVYVCAFFFFLYEGLYSNDYDIAGFLSESNVSIPFQSKVLSDLSFDKIFITNEIYIVKNYLGLATFGIYPLIMLIYNGGFFGMFVSVTIQNTSLSFVVAHTLPHSFELVPVILSAADSIFLGVHFVYRILRGHSHEINYLHFFKNFLLYTIIIAIAAFCESHVTP